MQDRRSATDPLPLVSIGLPVYNGIKFIRRSLDSLLSQTYPNYELIISDNHSNDGTWELLQIYAQSDKRISLYRQERNIGAFGNFGFVLSKAEGRYFMWAAVDDLWLPEFTALLVTELETHADAGVAMCAIERRYEDGNFLDIIRFEGKRNPVNRTYYGMMKGLTSKIKYNLYIYGLFRTELLRRAIRNYPEVPGGDRLLICQLALATRFRYIDRILHVRTHHRVLSSVRLPNEKFNKMMNEDKLVDIKILLALGRMIYHSDIIPRHRKVYLPIVMWRYGWLILFERIGMKIRAQCAEDTWNMLKRIKNYFFL